MASRSPIIDRHQDDDATLIPYGTPARSALVVDTFGEPQAEYSAIRKGAGLMDLPHRGLIRVSGADTFDFLKRMLTQKIDHLKAGDSANSFWTNRQGRVIADLRVILREGDVLLELDTLNVENTIETLDAFIIMDEVQLEDISESHHRLAIHGPRAVDLLRGALAVEFDDPAPNANATIEALGTIIHIDRRDSTGEIGLELTAEKEHIPALYDAITKHAEQNADLKARPIGWAAYNTARIEAGTPINNIDFGEKSLPAETGVLDDRVNFAKGCYPGQEVVARMQSLGGPKQKLVSLQFPGSTHDTTQPQTGDAIAAPDNPDKPIGAITSSTRGPMLSGDIVCLAQIRTAHAEPGTELTVLTEGEHLAARVRDTLAAYAPQSAGA